MNQVTEKELEFIHLLQSSGIKVKVFRCDGVVERAFVTLYGRVRAMLNYAHVEGDIHKSLWVECGKTATDLDEILCGKNETENSYKKCLRKIQTSLCIYKYLEKWDLCSHTNR